MTNPFLRMEQHKASFTQNDMKIYQAILDNPKSVIYNTTSDFARIVNVSQPALTRFIQSVGYRKYNDFRAEIASWQATQDNNKVSGSSIPYFDAMRSLLNETEKLLTKEYLNSLAEYILSFPHIFASGMGKSYSPAILLQNLLRKYKIFVNTPNLDSLAEVSENLSHDDLLIIFSVSASSSIMGKFEGTDAKVLLITANPTKELEKTVDRVVHLPYLPPEPESCSISPILFSILVELIVSYIGEKLYSTTN